MALIVQKFGGTSVGDAARIRAVAQRVAKTKRAGHDVVVVVSAMAGETNRLVALAHDLTPDPIGREYDVLISTGEQVTIALLAMALQVGGTEAVSYLGHQVRILTDSAFSKARIQDIDTKTLRAALKKGAVVVVAGFQGVDAKGNVTTLGRGGSDTTAVALAAALKADLCEIYTDVDGVYTTDPRICPDAQKIERISYEEMLEMASTGAKVLQIRSVEFAAKFGVPLVVRSSFNDNPGTIIVKEEKGMEHLLVSGVSFNRDEAKLALRNLPDIPGVASRIFSTIAAANVNVDMIVQTASRKGATDLTFTVPKSELREAQRALHPLVTELKIEEVETRQDIAKVSVIGIGMRSHSGVAAQMFHVLAKKNINIHMISTSEIKVSVVIDEARLEDAIRALHSAFGLEKPRTPAPRKAVGKRVKRKAVNSRPKSQKNR